MTLFSGSSGWQLEVPSLGQVPAPTITAPRGQELSISLLHLLHREMICQAQGPRMGWSSLGEWGDPSKRISVA